MTTRMGFMSERGQVYRNGPVRDWRTPQLLMFGAIVSGYGSLRSSLARADDLPRGLVDDRSRDGATTAVRRRRRANRRMDAFTNVRTRRERPGFPGLPAAQGADRRLGCRWQFRISIPAW